MKKAQTVINSKAPGKHRSAMKRQENIIGWLFVLPALIAFLVFIAFPFLASLGLSFASWNFVGGWKKL
ncbi:MAG: sugar ABC transporter permease, partial [Clostridia bacterium]|nr:sugar ABC transporter permease [Clostridia bacterium]